MIFLNTTIFNVGYTARNNDREENKRHFRASIFLRRGSVRVGLQPAEKCQFLYKLIIFPVKIMFSQSFLYH